MPLRRAGASSASGRLSRRRFSRSRLIGSSAERVSLRTRHRGRPDRSVSIDERQPPQFHFDLGKKLAPLRAEGVLIVGSGNLVHNLHTYAWGRHVPEPYDWAVRFETEARRHLISGNYQALVDYEALGKDALLAIPTPEHYLPLLYVIGARQRDDDVLFPVQGVDGGSISMLCVEVKRGDSRA